MQRAITGFHLDDEEHWVAELDCFHGQHVRHNPPFESRPWVEREEGRMSMIGESLNCVRCDRLELPDNVTVYKKTPIFSETTLPPGLLKDHTTKKGTWGLIHLLEGELIYRVNGRSPQTYTLSKNNNGIIAPQMPHSVEPVGKVAFYIEFLSLVQEKENG